jgi:hypothetical protein
VTLVRQGYESAFEEIVREKVVLTPAPEGEAPATPPAG